MAKVPTTPKFYKSPEAEPSAHIELFLMYYQDFQFTVQTQNFENKLTVYVPFVLESGFLQTLKLNWAAVWTPVETTLESTDEGEVYHESFLLNWKNTSVEFFSNGVRLHSRTSVFPGRCWPEREMRERCFKPIRGLKDARRLLSDYATLYNPVEVSYNHLVQEII